MTVGILAVLTDPETARGCLDAASALAAAVPGGVIEAFHPRPKPESMILTTEEVATDTRLTEIQHGLDGKSAALRHIVDAWTAAGDATRPTAWNEIEGESIEKCVAGHCKKADVIVLVRPADADGKAALHAAIFETRRLLLLVPPSGEGSMPFGRHMAIAWKTGDQAARAVTAAIPWLKQAAAVSVLAAGRPGEPASADDALALLDSHGIKAVPVLLQENYESIAAALLRTAHAIGADCIVMGAYRHSRLIEFVLGGVTREMLRDADLPVFMLH